MFDWEEEQFANMIWGESEAVENGDHIVPYPPHQTMASLPFFSQPNATKLDPEHTDESSQKFNNRPEQDINESKIVGANVGSFSDLDTLLRNHDIDCGEKSPSLHLKTEKHTNDSLRKMKEKMDGKRIRCQNTTNEKRKAIPPLYIHPLPSRHMMSNEHSYVSALPHQQVSSARSYISEKSRDIPMSMTPEEKIEKLRRRQQMRALVAIRKQQQELARVDESLSTINSLEESSVSFDKSTLGDTVLHQLQDVIARMMLLQLGIEIRLCMRDSLFRLAQTALYRRTRDEPTFSCSERTLDEETKTNPIDRAVAHLLFFTPPDLSEKLLKSQSSVKLSS